MSDMTETQSIGRGRAIGLAVGALVFIWAVTALVGENLVLGPDNSPAPTAWMFLAAVLVLGIGGAFAFWKLGSNGQTLAAGALIVAVLSVVYVALAALGSKWGWWDFRNGFAMLLGPWGQRVMFGAVGLSLAALIIGAVTPNRVRPLILAIPATFVAVRLIATIAGQGTLAGSVPPIHDIQTNWDDPVVFSEALMTARGPDSNPVRYGADAVFGNPDSEQFGGKLIGDIQEAAECTSEDEDVCEDSETPKPYKPIKPLMIDAAPAAVFEAAARIADQRGWDVVTSDAAGGVLEVTHTSPWWGFKDDLGIRIRADGAGSLVDVRSISRVGGSDLGANAARISAFLYELDGQRYN